MSNRGQNRKPGGSTEWLQMSKAERRAAAKAAKARAAAAKRRRQMLASVAAGLAIVGVLIGVFFLIRGAVSSDDSGAGQSSAAQSSTASGGTPTAAGAASNAAFPPLPAGADPALATKPTVGAGTGEVTALKVTPLIEGTGAAAQTGQQITVNYVGVTFRDGKEFDASWNRSEPFSFQLGSGNVIAGWDQGLVGAKVGSRVQLDIPSNLAYGDNPGAGRPGGPLRFVVDVLAVQ
jgi:FKBP-type peptidyl-prolyl cis-trans isomerase